MGHLPREKYTGLEGQTRHQQPRLRGAPRCSATRLPRSFGLQVFQEMKCYCTGHHAPTTALIYTKLPLAKFPLHLCKGELLGAWGPDPSRAPHFHTAPRVRGALPQHGGLLGTPSSKGTYWADPEQTTSPEVPEDLR